MRRKRSTMSSKVAPLSASFFLSFRDASLKFASPHVRQRSGSFFFPGQHFAVSPPASRLSDSFLMERSRVPSLPCERSLAEPPPCAVRPSFFSWLHEDVFQSIFAGLHASGAIFRLLIAVLPD